MFSTRSVRVGPWAYGIYTVRLETNLALSHRDGHCDVTAPSGFATCPRIGILHCWELLTMERGAHGRFGCSLVTERPRVNETSTRWLTLLPVPFRFISPHR